MAIRDLIPWNRDDEKKVVVRRQEREPFHELQRSMNRLFDDFFGSVSLPSLAGFGERFGAFQPHIDVSESDKAITVSAELPGLDEKEIEVSLDRNTLTISGEKKEEKEKKDKNYYRMERSYGSFRRSIPLPTEIEPDQVEATFKNGVLTINLPKSPEVQKLVKHIAVKSE